MVISNIIKRFYSHRSESVKRVGNYVAAIQVLYYSVSDRILKMDMRKVLARNLKMLLTRNGWSEHELGRRAGVSPRTINTITNEQSNATTGVIARLAKPFNLEPWHLLLPNLPDDSSLRSRIEDLIGYYCKADVETQGFVDHILRHGKLTP